MPSLFTHITCNFNFLSFFPTVVSYSRTAAVAKKPCSNLIKGEIWPSEALLFLLVVFFCVSSLSIPPQTGLQRVRAICQILRLNKEIEELAQTYYNKAYQHDSFIKVTLHKKEVLGGCCILLSCRLLNWPLSMGTVSSLLEADPAQLGTVYLEMVKVLNIEAPVTNVTAVMEGHCAE